jgi:hypothetical protein
MSPGGDGIASEKCRHETVSMQFPWMAMHGDAQVSDSMLSQAFSEKHRAPGPAQTAGIRYRYTRLPEICLRSTALDHIALYLIGKKWIFTGFSG